MTPEAAEDLIAELDDFDGVGKAETQSSKPRNPERPAVRDVTPPENSLDPPEAGPNADPLEDFGLAPLSQKANLFKGASQPPTLPDTTEGASPRPASASGTAGRNASGRQADDELLGDSVTTSADEPFMFRCPVCDSWLSAESTERQTQVVCSDCHSRVDVPKSQHASGRALQNVPGAYSAQTQQAGSAAHPGRHLPATPAPPASPAGSRSSTSREEDDELLRLIESPEDSDSA